MWTTGGTAVGTRGWGCPAPYAPRTRRVQEPGQGNDEVEYPDQRKVARSKPSSNGGNISHFRRPAGKQYVVSTDRRRTVVERELFDRCNASVLVTSSRKVLKPSHDKLARMKQNLHEDREKQKNIDATNRKKAAAAQAAAKRTAT